MAAPQCLFANHRLSGHGLMVFNKLNIMDLLDHEHLQEDTFQDLTTLILHYLIYLTEEPEGPKANIDLWELLEAYLHHAEEHHRTLSPPPA